MKGHKSLINHLYQIGAFLLVIFIIISGLFLKVWKEEHNKQYARSYTSSRKRLNYLTSECATLEVAISELSTSQRLTRYAEDSLGMTLPTPGQVIAVYRESTGKLVRDELTIWSRLKAWFTGGGQ